MIINDEPLMGHLTMTMFSGYSNLFDELGLLVVDLSSQQSRCCIALVSVVGGGLSEGFRGTQSLYIISEMVPVLAILEPLQRAQEEQHQVHKHHLVGQCFHFVAALEIGTRDFRLALFWYRLY